MILNMTGGGNPLNFKESTEYPGCYYRTVDGVTEWLNPPMVVGTEYRTVERFKNKPVCVKAINFGKIESKSVSVNIAGTNVVSLYGYGVDSNGTVEYFPMLHTETGEAVAVAWYESKKINVASFHSGLSGYTATFVIKYTK